LVNVLPLQLAPGGELQVTPMHGSVVQALFWQLQDDAWDV